MNNHRITTLVVLLCCKLSWAQFTFTEREAFLFSADTGPGDVILTDVDHDSVLDIILVNQFTGDVSVLLGQGLGTFRLGQTVDVGRYATQMAMGDFNGDLIPDLAVGHTSLDRVSILLGRSDGTFVQGEDIPVGLSPKTVETGDFNADGFLDLAVGAFQSERVSIHLGRGDGTFSEGGTYRVGLGPNLIRSGDFNQDGILDLAITNSGLSQTQPDVRVSILLGRGDGSFEAAPDIIVGLNPMGLAVADLNGDSVQDLVVTNWGSRTVTILLGDGTGQFSPFREYGVQLGPTGVTIADLDGDSLPDLAVSNAVGDSLSFLRGHGDGTFDSAQTFQMRCCKQSPGDCRCAPLMSVAGHVMSDQSLDLVVPRAYARDVALLINGSP